MPAPRHETYDPAGCAVMPRHVHTGYRPPAAVAQRCPAGHRDLQIRVGGPIPPVVSCTVCQQQNRTATAYERGRADARARS
jgi:hypothetical protein